MNDQKLSQQRHASLVRSATYASVSIAFVLIFIKIIAYVMTGSVALLSSVIDSIFDAFASFLNLLAVRKALMPADREHRFGHGKAEPLAGLGQGAFITGSSLFLVFEALNHLVNPRPIEHGMIGIVVIVFSLLLTIALVSYQNYVVKQTNSIAVGADSIHYKSDVFLNLSVIVALVLSAFMDWPLADPIIALCIAVFIIYSAWTIVQIALNQLMDKELPDVDRDKIEQIALDHPKVHSLHELRTRASGKEVFIQLHLEMDGDLTLVDAHEIADQVEEKLQCAFPHADIIIHEDPAGLEIDIKSF